MSVSQGAIARGRAARLGALTAVLVAACAPSRGAPESSNARGCSAGQVLCAACGSGSFCAVGQCPASSCPAWAEGGAADGAPAMGQCSSGQAACLDCTGGAVCVAGGCAAVQCPSPNAEAGADAQQVTCFGQLCAPGEMCCPSCTPGVGSCGAACTGQACLPAVADAAGAYDGSSDATVVPIVEEPGGTAVGIPCDALLAGNALLAVSGSDLLILEPNTLLKIGPASELTSPVITAPSNYFQGAKDFVVDATTLYWSNYQSIQTMSLSGGTPATLPVSSGDVISGPNELFVQDPYLYFSHTNDGNLYRVAIDGKTADTQIGTFPTPRMGTSTNGIAWLADNVYWAFDELVLSAPAAGGSTTTVAQASTTYAKLFGAAGTAIFWSGPSEGYVRTTLPSGNETLLADPINSRIGAFDGTSVFGARANSAGNPRIVSVPASGGAVTDIAAVGSQRTLNQILVTTQYIYWTATRQCPTPAQCPNFMGTCEARRIAKP